MMSIRLAVLELAARHRLDASNLSSLWKLAALGRQPAPLLPELRRYLAYIAALLAGLGSIFTIAANWSSFGRAGQFTLLEALVFMCCFATFYFPKARQPFALLALLSTGALLAFFGQTYQTGADPWQLFATWGILTLPLALAVRADMVWMAWALVAAIGLGAWNGKLGSMSYSSESLVEAHMATALMASGIAILLGPPMRRYTGSGRCATYLTLSIATAMTCLASFAVVRTSNMAVWYPVCLALNACGCCLFSRRRFFDILSLSIAAFGLNCVLMFCIVELVWSSENLFRSLFLIVLVASCFLSLTIWGIQSLERCFWMEGDKP